MAKAKIARKSTAIDMTPMVDLAFLLITFFMLTVKFRPQESVEVSTPSSIAESPIPATDIMIVTVAKDGRIFFSVDSKNTRMRMVQEMGKAYGIEFTPEEINAFGVQPDVGVPIVYLKQWLALDPEARKKNAQGVPTDSTKNELKDWVLYARLANPKLRIAIKGDQDAPFKDAKKVFDTLQGRKIDKFNLITSAEAANVTIEK